MRTQGGSPKSSLFGATVAVAVAVMLLALACLPDAVAAHPRTAHPRRSAAEPIYRVHLPSVRGRARWRRISTELDGRMRSRRPQARASIVGGATIEISQAPWQAFVIAVVPVGNEEALVLLCGGSVLDQTHVLTAGHCLYDPLDGQRIPPADMAVVVGASNVAVREAGAQELEVRSIRVHPDYDYAAGPGTPDDVGVIALEGTLSFGSRVQPIALAGAGPAEGSSVTLTGFGLEQPGGEIEGPLHSLNLTTGFSSRCGGEADAVFICATAPGGSGCNGDSGSALTTGSTPVLVGVMDTVQLIAKVPCIAGADNGFVNATAPEIRDFVEGSETPPLAPRGGSTVALEAVPTVGYLATCSPGSWSGSPSFAYEFLDSSTGQALQSGPSSTYRLTEADVGLAISCEVLASNAGGTGVSRTTALPPVRASEEAKKEQEKGSTTPYVPPELPWANESGREAAERTVREAHEAEARRAAERKTAEEREAFERAQREAEARAASAAKRSCVVPRLRGDSLAAARRALAAAHCALGRVTLPRRGRHHLVVVHQTVAAGRRLSAGSRVGVSMGHLASRAR